MIVLLVEQHKPTNYEEAKVGPKSEIWLEAMESKIESMYDYQV
jgi:hypothetical protein